MDRATSSVVAVALLVSLTVLAASAVGTAALVLNVPALSPSASLTVSSDAGSNTITMTHHGGDALDVDTLRVVVSIDDQQLAHQPPVPFFAAAGFQSGPTGPFNPAASSVWAAGETAQFTLAGTNEPLPQSGDEITVRIVRGNATVATLRATAT